MLKSDIRILVLEDDPSVSRALEEGLKRSGYTVQVASHYSQAMNATKMLDFHGIVADCMLPQKSGVDVVVELLKNSPHDTVVLLTSGVFRDKAYAHEAQLKTRAKAFMQKPFDLQELIGHFDEAFAEKFESTKGPLFQLLAQEQYSARDKLTALEQAEYVHGHDLPYIYSLLSDPQISGSLHIHYEDKPKSVVGFYRGTVDKVQHADSESYFGVLLLEKGFTTPEELQMGLDEQNDMPIGARLIENSSVSPHAVEAIHHEQMVIRISKTIQDTSVRIKFVEDFDKPEPRVSLDSFLLMRLLSDWICSKLSQDWLLSFYTPWLENPVLKGPEWSKLNKVKGLPATAALGDFLKSPEWPANLQSILSEYPSREEDVLRGLHFLLLQRVIYFGRKIESDENYDIKLTRLNKIWTNFQDQNFFAILGVSSNARPSEIHRAYHELAKTLHPDKLSPNSPAALRELTQKVFGRITEAYQTLSNERRRKDYQKILELGMAEEILKSEGIFEEGMRHLKVNRFRDARKCFESAMKLKGHRSDTLVYLVWALIKEKRGRSKQYELFEKVRSYMMQIPHEDRHSAHYFFVKGLYYEFTGQLPKAYKNLKHSLTIDPYFTDAKKEIALVHKMHTEHKSKTLTGELSTVVTKFFKKKVG